MIKNSVIHRRNKNYLIHPRFSVCDMFAQQTEINYKLNVKNLVSESQISIGE